MGANRSPRADAARHAAVAGLAILLVGLARPAGPALARAPLSDAPVAWYAADRADVAMPNPRQPNLMRDQLDASFVRPVGRFFNPARLARHLAAPFGAEIATPAVDVNDLDEVLNSTWFTNRIGLFPLTPEDVARGAATNDGPARDTPWRLTRAKTQGVTPGFNIVDGRGDTYVVKLDPACCVGGPSAADVVTGRLLHAAGYNVPEDFVVNFRREDVLVGDGVLLTDAEGSRRAMTPADLDSLLARVGPGPDGTYRAVASRFLAGRSIGPFDWKGRRRDDPADRANHENRRELRGLRMICAWLAHFDMKQHNTLDVWVEEDGRRFVKHHLIDFASTLGMGAEGPTAMENMEYGFDLSAIFGRLLALGFHEDGWRGLQRPPGLPEVGYFEATVFDPMEWKPLQPNAAFANLTDRDGYWAAKVISAFRDEHLAAAVAEGGYGHPAAAEYLARMLAARRDIIARTWFDRVPPLDFFRFVDGTLRFHDLGAERGVYPGTTPRYRVRLAACDAGRNAATWTAWAEADGTVFDVAATAGAPPGRDATPARRPFLVFEVGVDRGSGWSRSIRVHVSRATGRVVAVDR